MPTLQEGPMTTTDVTPAKPALALRIFVIVFAAIETLGWLWDIQNWLDLPTPSPGFELAQYAGNAYTLLQPPLAVAALLLGIIGRVRYAIMALAIMVLASW